ncbi:MAG: cobalt-precorrin-5B (C(1))-methyltransferase CbiD [Desulfatiglandales bacterium]
MRHSDPPKASKRLRSGFTTGATASAATKGALIYSLLKKGVQIPKRDSLIFTEKKVEIPFPQGERYPFQLEEVSYDLRSGIAVASAIKDAGDDPDVTHGALIAAEVRCLFGGEGRINIRGGEGVGVVTKPGLPIGVGEPAINPVPRKMIREAIEELILPLDQIITMDVTIHVPEGRRLAKKTLNGRLGIVDGISILGTTGIVKPLSSDAWTDSITAQIKVAKAMGVKELVLSTGRSSERAHMSKYGYPEEAYIMAGDFMAYSILEAKRSCYSSLVINGQFAKLLKLAMGGENTHVRHGTLSPKEVISKFSLDIGNSEVNTMRELLDIILAKKEEGIRILEGIFRTLVLRLNSLYGIKTSVVLSDYRGNVLIKVE